MKSDFQTSDNEQYKIQRFSRQEWLLPARRGAVWLLTLVATVQITLGQGLVNSTEMGMKGNSSNSIMAVLLMTLGGIVIAFINGQNQKEVARIQVGTKTIQSQGTGIPLNVTPQSIEVKTASVVPLETNYIPVSPAEFVNDLLFTESGWSHEMIQVPGAFEVWCEQVIWRTLGTHQNYVEVFPSWIQGWMNLARANAIKHYGDNFSEFEVLYYVCLHCCVTFFKTATATRGQKSYLRVYQFLMDLLRQPIHPNSLRDLAKIIDQLSSNYANTVAEISSNMNSGFPFAYRQFQMSQHLLNAA